MTNIAKPLHHNCDSETPISHFHLRQRRGRYHPHHLTTIVSYAKLGPLPGLVASATLPQAAIVTASSPLRNPTKRIKAYANSDRNTNRRIMGKVHVSISNRPDPTEHLLTLISTQGSLARAGKVKSQTPKVPHRAVHPPPPALLLQRCYTFENNASPTPSYLAGCLEFSTHTFMTGCGMSADESGDGRLSLKRRRKRT